MAAQVELGPALAPLAGRSELASPAKLQRAFASPRSEAGGQPSERPEERGPRPAAMTPAPPRPRLTPKPFCRERSVEAFAAVKPPVPSEGLPAARGAAGSVPPLLDHKLVESRAGGEVVASVPFCASPQANTVILFETGSADRARVTLTPDRHLAGAPRALGPPLAQEGGPPPSTPEGAGVQRQLSLSSESRPAPWSPGSPLERTGAPAEKAPEGQRQPSGRRSPASGGQPRPKPRPVSAIFLESKHGAPDVAGEQPLPEQPWARKPRPLSVDLTARFESRGLCVPRQPCPSEARQRLPAAALAEVGHGGPSQADVAGLGRADLSRPAWKAAARVADSPQSLKPAPDEAAPSCHSVPRDSSAQGRKCLWESRRRSRGEPPEREAGLAAALAKGQEPCGGRGPAGQERAALSLTGTAGQETSARAPGADSRSSRGGVVVMKRLSSPDPSANGAAPAKAESLPASPDKESRILNIQQRIKELTADSADAKPGNLRRSFRSRPLSADLTRLFSSSAGGSDRRPERQAEASRRPLGEPREVPESEARPPSGPGGREARGLGVPWKPQQAVKLPRADGPLEKDGRFARERPDVTPLQAEDAPPLRTVRATLFEHSVQRHNVAVDRLVTEPGLRPSPALAQAVAKEGPSKPANTSLEAEKPGRAELLPGDPALAAKERVERAPPRPLADSWQSQRIEPRYEVLQTVGERVRSEAVAAVAGDQAVTLRSRRSLRERRRAEEGAPWPGSLDLWREDKTKELGEAAGKTCAVQRRDVPPRQPLAPYEQTSEWKARRQQQQQVPVRGAPPPGRGKDLRAADDPTSSLSLEREKEKPDACLADRTGGSPVPRRFPGSPGARPGCEVGVGAGEGVAPARAGEQEGPSSPGAAGQRPKRSSSSKASPVGVGTRTCAREAPGAPGLQERASAHSAKAGLADAGCPLAEDWGGLLDVGEGGRRGPRGGSNPRAADRWRRRTLPHGAAHREDARALAAGSAEALSRRDSSQLLRSSSLAQRHQRGAEPPSEGSRNQPRSPSEPGAASGAGVAQGQDEDGGATDPLRSQPAPWRTEAPSPPGPAAGTARRSRHQPSARLADPPGSLGGQRSQSWGEGGTPDLPRPGDARGEPSRHPGGAPFQAEPVPPSRVRPLPPDRLAQGKDSGGYRSRVLDIDALMAEYKEDPPRGVGGLFPWEKLARRRDSADKTSGRYDLSSPRGSDPSPGSARRGLCAATDFHSPEHLRPREPERVERCPRESSPLQAGDASLSPPHWGRLAAEKPKRSPADPTRTPKKTFILDEDGSESFLQAASGTARLDAGLGAGQAPPEGVCRKGASPAQQAGGVPPEESCPRKAVHASSLDRRRGGAGVGAPGASPAESSPPEPGLANAPHDLRRSYSEKVRQARARGSGPWEPGGREGGHPSSLPGRADGWPGRRGMAGQDSSFRDEERDLGGEWPEQGVRSPPFLPARRRSRSFYTERRTDHWAAGSRPLFRRAIRWRKVLVNLSGVGVALMLPCGCA
ncbi:hypothetical protein lerEdw1_003599 [Lerista edwardsae]|nr:hypothetical protein lerEdw1_003599 [Lerista edwardsae]